MSQNIRLSSTYLGAFAPNDHFTKICRRGASFLAVCREFSMCWCFLKLSTWTHVPATLDWILEINIFMIPIRSSSFYLSLLLGVLWVQILCDYFHWELAKRNKFNCICCKIKLWIIMIYVERRMKKYLCVLAFLRYITLLLEDCIFIILPHTS